MLKKICVHEAGHAAAAALLGAMPWHVYVKPEGIESDEGGACISGHLPRFGALLVHAAGEAGEMLIQRVRFPEIPPPAYAAVKALPANVTTEKLMAFFSTVEAECPEVAEASDFGNITRTIEKLAAAGAIAQRPAWRWMMHARIHALRLLQRHYPLFEEIAIGLYDRRSLSHLEIVGIFNRYTLQRASL